MLISEEGTGVQEARPAPPPDFRLPLRNLSNTKVLDYLTKQRRIAPAIVEHFIASGDLYEEASHHNAVFVGRDKTGLPPGMPTAGERRTGSGWTWPVRINPTASATTRARAASFSSLKRPLICCPSSACTPRTGKAEATSLWAACPGKRWSGSFPSTRTSSRYFYAWIATRRAATPASAYGKPAGQADGHPAVTGPEGLE